MPTDPTTPPPAAETPTHTQGEVEATPGGTQVRTVDGRKIIAICDIQMRWPKEVAGNARRLAAAWNACRHFSTSDLESIGLGPYADVMSGKGDNDGVRLIATERMRQVMEKGYTAKHDDQHTDGSIAECAALIALDDPDFLNSEGWQDQSADDILTNHDGDRIRQLTIAGALIAAEIDRLRRAKSTPAAPTANTLQL